MSAKAVREAAGKNLLNKFLTVGVAVKTHFATVTADTDWTSLEQEHPWLSSQVNCWFYHFCLDAAYCYRCSMVCVCLLVSCAKTAEPIQMPLRMWTWVGQGTVRVLGGVPDPPGEGAVLGASPNPLWSINKVKVAHTRIPSVGFRS